VERARETRPHLAVYLRYGHPVSARDQWAVVARLADGRHLYWCAPGSRQGGQDQWSPRASQALRYAMRADAERVIAGFDQPSAVKEYLVVRV
jgi:hypothetical protein